MTKKEYLQSAYRLDELIESDMRELQSLRELLVSIQSQNTEREPVASSRINSASFTRVLEKIAAFEEKINGEIDRYVDLKKEIRRVIDEVPDRDEQMCLRYRYIEFMTWEEIAEKMHYSVMQTARIHGKALESVVIPEKML